MISLGRRAVVRTLVGVLAALAVAGFLYEAASEARDARRFPAPGTLIDVGGRRLHLVCLGAGRPTVLFEASAFSNSLSFDVARAALATHTTVCSYDRAGVGWSDPGPGIMSAGTLAEDLHRMETAAALAPPFVIVASSIGGVTAEMFARRYPERVAGLVFADAANSDLIALSAPTGQSLKLVEWRAACLAATAAGRLGMARLFDPFGLRRSPSDGAVRSAALMYRAQPWVTLCAMVRGLSTTQEEFRRAPALRRDVPVVVLTAERSDGLLPPALAGAVSETELRGIVRLLGETHRRLAQRSARGSWRLVSGSDHLIANSRPQAVVDAVLELLAHIRGA